ncbi:hypothetical protein JS510_01680 [Mycoplasma tauri]|nr:hypothetical protein [Mycoplasma tauri]QSB07211.1 hypothetical protein JS510_01680 [Mycoplasma tauri]
MEIKEKNQISELFANKYKIIGLPLFNQQHDKIKEFKSYINEFIKNI